MILHTVTSMSDNATAKWVPAKSWQHFVAGGFVSTSSSMLMAACTDRNVSLGGMCGAIVTSPFDVVKTRLQSSLFREAAVLTGPGSAVLTVPARRAGLLWHFVETGHIMRSVVHLT